MLNEDEMYDGPYFFPLEQGDQLFMNDQAQLELDALENYAYRGYKSGQLMVYSLAYKEAADRLVQTLHEYYSATLTLPIVFLYRHYVELSLKDLLSMGIAKYSKPSTPRLLNTHKIDLLWRELKPFLQQIYSAKESEGIEAVEACIMEFSNMDERSFSFRYPVDTKGNFTLKNNSYLRELEYIDVHHLAEKMASMPLFADLLIGIVSSLYQNAKSPD
jgi:hypothetical protein